MSNHYIPAMPPLQEAKELPKAKPAPKPQWVKRKDDDLDASAVSINYSIGQISHIELPRGWQPAPVQDDEALGTIHEFNPPSGSESRLEFFYRGKRVSAREGENFHKILNEGGHVLSQAELRSVRTILRGKDNVEDFKVELAWVAVLNRKTVLMIEGTFNADQVRNLTVLIDSDGTGTAIQELALYAPEKPYQRFKPLIEKSLQTIKWK